MGGKETSFLFFSLEKKKKEELNRREKTPCTSEGRQGGGGRKWGDLLLALNVREGRKKKGLSFEGGSLERRREYSLINRKRGIFLYHRRTGERRAGTRLEKGRGGDGFSPPKEEEEKRRRENIFLKGEKERRHFYLL